MVNFFEEPPWCFPQRLRHFTFPPAMNKDYRFFTASPNTCYFNTVFLTELRPSAFQLPTVAPGSEIWKPAG